MHEMICSGKEYEKFGKQDPQRPNPWQLDQGFGAESKVMKVSDSYGDVCGYPVMLPRLLAGMIRTWAQKGAVTS